ncbi:hypothetical protein NW752_001708 [Fusarium irregulare]|uniref:Cell wall glycoprotein n=1 Tax=Fusarium irregulare TaxID=2494466 RepID=A0A9W8PTV9_9HYPO|nr:hypothetical protein LB507_005015 [Fusarium sp. FIESC RH6]KAJ4017802.1 hypothetical protein NW766_003871 [Fusarium irregulare]KAJ4026754.1 hypothetical protein NW752_001708 [Fusarium irregulare]
MLSNTGSLVFGLLSVAQLVSATPSDTAVAFSSPIYPTATDIIPPPASTGTETKPAPPVSTDDCLAKCEGARDKCSTASDANQATCAAAFADCVGYAPYDTEGNYVPPTACSSATTLASTVKPTEPAKPTEEKPTGEVKPEPTGEVKPEPTETAVIVSGAGHVSSGQVVGLLGAVGIAALAFL